MTLEPPIRSRNVRTILTLDLKLTTVRRKIAQREQEIGILNRQVQALRAKQQLLYGKLKGPQLSELQRIRAQRALPPSGRPASEMPDGGA